MPSDAAAALHRTIQAAGIGEHAELVTLAGTTVSGRVTRLEDDLVALEKVVSSAKREWTSETVVPLDRIVSVHFKGVAITREDQ